MTIYTEQTQNAIRYGVPALQAFESYEDAQDIFSDAYNWLVREGYSIEVCWQNQYNDPYVAVFKKGRETVIITIQEFR